MLSCLALCFHIFVLGMSVPVASEISNVELDESRDGIILELLRRIKLLEARASLVEVIDQNQQSQFESLYRLIALQEGWLHQVNETQSSTTGAQEVKDGAVGTQEVTSAPEHVAFTAYLDHDLDGLGVNQTVIFNKVILNDGDAYNDLTGTFTVPRNGVYDIYFSIGQRDEKQLRAKLCVNGDHVISAASDTYHQYQDLQGGNRVLKHLHKGDIVTVKNAHGGHFEGSDDLRITSFSGIFLYG